MCHEKNKEYYLVVQIWAWLRKFHGFQLRDVILRDNTWRNMRQFFEIQALPCLVTTSNPGVDSRWLTKKSIYRRRQYSLRWPWTYCRTLYVTMNEEQALVLRALQVSISLGPLFAKSKLKRSASMAMMYLLLSIAVKTCELLTFRDDLCCHSSMYLNDPF